MFLRHEGDRALGNGTSVRDWETQEIGRAGPSRVISSDTGFKL